MNTNERRMMIFSQLDTIAEKFVHDDEVRSAIWDWDVTIAELALRFEEVARRNVPIPPRIEHENPVPEVQDVDGDEGQLNLSEMQ